MPAGARVTAETLPARDATAGEAARGGWIALALLGGAILVVASLAKLHEPTYDPTAWLIWGRELAHGKLVTVQGPTWKPFPVFFTTLFSLAGDRSAPTLWLAVARFGGVAAVILAYRIAARLAGPVAGAIAGVSLVLAGQFVRTVALGDSEGLLVALALWALDCHLLGRRRMAFGLLVAAGLMRPETWPFIAAYGGWLVLERRRELGETPWRMVAIMAGIGVLLLLAWFVPEKVGSGSFLRGAQRARLPVPGSPAESSFPFGAVFWNSRNALAIPVYVGALLCVLIAVRDRRRHRGAGVLLVVAAVAAALMAIVGVLAQAGFTGNLRYVTLPAALITVLAGVGWVWAVAEIRNRGGARRGLIAACLLLAAAVPFAVRWTHGLVDDVNAVRRETHLYALLPTVIREAGGPRALLACGPLYTGPLQTQAVAWHMHLEERQVLIEPTAPGAVIVTKYAPYDLAALGFEHTLYKGSWIVRTSCRTGAATGH